MAFLNIALLWWAHFTFEHSYISTTAGLRKSTEKICRLKFNRLFEESWTESKIGESLLMMTFRK